MEKYVQMTQCQGWSQSEGGGKGERGGSVEGVGNGRGESDGNAEGAGKGGGDVGNSVERTCKPTP